MRQALTGRQHKARSATGYMLLEFFGLVDRLRIRTGSGVSANDVVQEKWGDGGLGKTGGSR